MRRAAALFSLIAVLFASPLFGQVVVQEIGTLQESYQTANKAFNSYQFPEALKALDPLLETLTKWEASGRLQPQDEALLEKALELRGICEFNIGKLDDARKDFERLINLRPDYPFARIRTPKIKKFFEDIRKQLTGTLELSVTPADSQVFLDGRSLGTGVPASIPVLKGLHVVKVVHQGYTSQEKELNVDVGTTVPFAVKLVPDARSIYFFVQPEGTKLYVDGKLVGTAEKTASSRDEWARFAQNNGADPSSIYVIPALYLPPGEHKVTLDRGCYAAREFRLNVELDKVNNRPGLIKPILLDRRTVELRLTSRPTGAEVSIDGRDYGKTPLKVDDFCIGRHDFLVHKEGVGEYKANIQVPDTSPFVVKATLRPTLLWVGFTREQNITHDQLQDADAALAKAVPAMPLFNGTIAKERDPLLPDTFFAQGVGFAVRASTAESLCSKYGCQGLLVGLLRSAPGKNLEVTLRLFVPGLPGYDETSDFVDGAGKAAGALGLLNGSPFKVTPSKVVALADLAGEPGPVFVRGVRSQGGPAPGDILLGVDSTITADAASALKDMQASAEPVLRFLHGGNEHRWTFKPDAFHEVIPYAGPEAGYRRFWLLAHQALLGAEDPVEGFAARLNVALAELNLGRPAVALEDLKDAAAPKSPFFGAATLDYVRAVALIQLGQPQKARPLLLAAAGDAKATLDGVGGILVQPLAIDLLRQLPAPPPPGKAAAAESGG